MTTASSNGKPKDPHAPKLLMIGWDGATPDLLVPWAQQGHLPNIARLLEAGALRRLRSTIPPVTACAWSSLLTGQNPGKHGLFDFVVPAAGDGYTFDYTHGGYRRGSELPAWLNQQGLSVGLVNMPMTYPPKPIDGFVVSGLDAPDEKSGIAHPAELFEQAQAAVGPYRIDNRHLGNMTTFADRLAVLEEFKAIETRRTDLTLAMYDRRPVDVLMMVYTATDQVQHHFWHYIDPDHPQRDTDHLDRLEGAILEIYQHCDHELGRLLERFGDATVMLLSDHGAGPSCGPRVRLNNVLSQGGFLRWASAKRFGASDVFSGVDRLLRRVLSARMKKMLLRMMPGARTRLEAAAMPPIDWENTVAFVNDGFTLSPCIWINRKDRFGQGCVEPGEEYESVVKRVRDYFESLRDPETGEPVIASVIPTRDVYHGPYAERAPDLLLNWWEGQTFSHVRSHPRFDGEPAVYWVRTPAVAGQDITGIHRRDGVLLTAGGPFAHHAALSLPPADLIDIAPTIMSLFSLPTPAAVDGRVLSDAAVPGALTATAGSGYDAEPDDEMPVGYSDADRERIEKRLADIGYIE